MTEIEHYEFDRLGYIIIEDMLRPEEVARLAKAGDELEEHALQHVDLPPRKFSGWGAEYHANQEKGYHARGTREEGQTLIIEDFWNADPAFDFLVGHDRTMEYANAVILGRPTINNSEIRIRYRGNASGSHGGYRPDNSKYRYQFEAEGINCAMVRMIYFIHDVSNEEGAFCVVPGTHKGNLPAPYSNNPDEEPGMVGLEVKAGDAIFFTEALRHGGLTNRSEQVRKTIHVGYGPNWMMSQNIATMDEPQHLTAETRSRYNVEQQNLLRAWPIKTE